MKKLIKLSEAVGKTLTATAGCHEVHLLMFGDEFSALRIDHGHEPEDGEIVEIADEEEVLGTWACRGALIEHGMVSKDEFEARDEEQLKRSSDDRLAGERAQYEALKRKFEGT